MQGRRVGALAALGQRASAWLVPALAAVVALSALLRSGLSYEPSALELLAGGLGLACALIGSSASWFGRSR